MSTHREICIANTIIDQIKDGTTSNTGRTIGGVQALMCWGARGYAALHQTPEREGGLSFRVDRIKFQGRVEVELAWNDTYIVKVGKSRHPNVYCDMLTEIIDSLVEAD